MRKGIAQGLTTLYLHGLESSIENTNKQKFLQEYFGSTGLISEDIDYNDRSCFDEYLDLIKSGDIVNFIGSSYGAASAFVLASIAKNLHPEKDIKVIMFNPPICNIPDYLVKYHSLSSMQQYIGWNDKIEYALFLSLYDEVVDPVLTMKLIRSNTDESYNLDIQVLNIGHRIPEMEFITSITDKL